ncbi:MAG: hypothetical protein J3K34DRAFT_441805 [Monoraphidium minutum]|nr:MAG: hypothetical protein J3K34DRAFT_441805 [Monoraphidium minutum]
MARVRATRMSRGSWPAPRRAGPKGGRGARRAPLQGASRAAGQRFARARRGAERPRRGSRKSAAAAVVPPEGSSRTPAAAAPPHIPQHTSISVTRRDAGRSQQGASPHGGGRPCWAAGAIWRPGRAGGLAAAGPAPRPPGGRRPTLRQGAVAGGRPAAWRHGVPRSTRFQAHPPWRNVAPAIALRRKRPPSPAPTTGPRRALGGGPPGNARGSGEGASEGVGRTAWGLAVGGAGAARAIAANLADGVMLARITSHHTTKQKRGDRAGRFEPTGGVTGCRGGVLASMQRAAVWPRLQPRPCGVRRGFGIAVARACRLQGWGEWGVMRRAK